MNWITKLAPKIKSILDSYSVGDFEMEALSILEKLFEENNIQIKKMDKKNKK